MKNLILKANINEFISNYMTTKKHAKSYYVIVRIDGIWISLYQVLQQVRKDDGFDIIGITQELPSNLQVVVLSFDTIFDLWSVNAYE